MHLYFINMMFLIYYLIMTLIQHRSNIENINYFNLPNLSVSCIFLLLEHRFIILDRRHSYLNPPDFPETSDRDELHAKHFRVCSFRTDRAKTLQTANRLKQTPCRERQTASLILAPRASAISRPSNTSVAQQHGSACVERVSSSARAFGRSAICTKAACHVRR